MFSPNHCHPNVGIWTLVLKFVILTALSDLLEAAVEEEGHRMAFSRGAHTLTVNATLFAENRRRLCAALRQAGAPTNSVVFLAGGRGAPHLRYNTDSAGGTPFRQESYFFWTFGVQESDFNGAIHVETGKSILFAPKLHPDYAIWQGRIVSGREFTRRYGVDDTYIVERSSSQISDELAEIFHPEFILLLKANNTDSDVILPPPVFQGMERFQLDTDMLYPIMAELRVIKTNQELEVMRYASKVGCAAHKAVMKQAKPGMYEYQLESLFHHHCYYNGGARYQAYVSIGASGCNCVILHYGHENAPNNRQIKDGDMCLFDMGPEYFCYASDVTISFPVNGKFTENQKLIYNAVLKANLAVFNASKPGVRWTDMHMLAERVLLNELKNGGLLQGDIDDMMAARLGGVFMPHGLGHFLGLDVHDVGGYLGDALPRSSEMGLKSLRTTRTLMERMVITIEPGCYFIDTLLDQAINDSKLSKFLLTDRINEFRGIGVRIEDDVVIWENGAENLSKDLPRTVAEIEAFMSG